MAEHDHGHTPAAWTGVIIVFVGFCVGGGFMIAAQPIGFWVGMGITVLGGVVGGVMRLMGLGKTDEPLALTPAAAATPEESRVSADA